MLQFSLPLHKNEQRPTVYIEHFYSLDAMLDTGSMFPVWVANEDKLIALGGKLIATDKPFGGFGGMTTGNIYEISSFRFGQLIFPYFHIVTCPRHLPCQLILPATMFRGLIYEVDNYNYMLNVTIPDQESSIRNLKIKDDNGRLYVLCTNDVK